MKRLAAVVASAMLLPLSACGLSDDRGTVSVTIFNSDRVALPQWPVAFQGSDGRLLDMILTDESGNATGPMEPDGMITYQAPFLDEHLLTHGGIQPGDRFVNVRPHVPAQELELRLIVSTSNTPAAARLCRIVVPCNGRPVTANGVPGTDITIDLPKGCAPADVAGQRTVYLLATATDDRAEAIAYASFDALTVTGSPARVTIDQWRDGFVELPVTVDDLGPGLVRYRAEVRAFVAEATVATFSDDGHGPADTVTSMVRLPGGIPATSTLRFDAWFEQAETVIEQPLGLDVVDQPPRMTTIVLDRERDAMRPTITFTTERPIDGPFTVAATLTAPGKSWVLTDMPGATVRLPELPSGFASFTADDLTLQSVGATTREPSSKGDIERVTAMPWIPFFDELPL